VRKRSAETPKLSSVARSVGIIKKSASTGGAKISSLAENPCKDFRGLVGGTKCLVNTRTNVLVASTKVLVVTTKQLIAASHKKMRLKSNEKFTALHVIKYAF